MEAPLTSGAGFAHYLDARSPAIQWLPERRAPCNLNACLIAKQFSFVGGV